MVAHEDVGVYGDTMLIHDIAQKIMKVVPIDVVNEDRAAIYPALGDMKRSARKLEARVTRHAVSLTLDCGVHSQRCGGCGVRESSQGWSVNSLRPLIGLGAISVTEASNNLGQFGLANSGCGYE